ncbi:MAG: hypothetical protein U9O56_00465 [Campylobacterota bacterium]|nr:hypothetical protein [Campylobacterota bacterium]
METIKKFEEILKADTNLATEYAKLIESKDEKVILDFIKTHGVSDEDIKALKNRELSDDELDGVNGGCEYIYTDYHVSGATEIVPGVWLVID